MDVLKKDAEENENKSYEGSNSNENNNRNVKMSQSNDGKFSCRNRLLSTIFHPHFVPRVYSHDVRG